MVVAVYPRRHGGKSFHMCRAVLDLGGDILRNILIHYVKPALVTSFVLASRYYRYHPLSPHYISILNEATIRGDYSQCDIALVYSLLRTLTPTSISVRPTAGWGKPVSDGDKTLGDDVQRIWYLIVAIYDIVYCTDYLSDTTHKTHMELLLSICYRMDVVHDLPLMSRSQTYCKIFHDLEEECMDPSMESKYLEEIDHIFRIKDNALLYLLFGNTKNIAGNVLMSYHLLISNITYQYVLLSNKACMSSLPL